MKEFKQIMPFYHHKDDVDYWNELDEPQKQWLINFQGWVKRGQCDPEWLEKVPKKLRNELSAERRDMLKQLDYNTVYFDPSFLMDDYSEEGEDSLTLDEKYENIMYSLRSPDYSAESIRYLTEKHGLIYMLFLINGELCELLRDSGLTEKDVKRFTITTIFRLQLAMKYGFGNRTPQRENWRKSKTNINLRPKTVNLKHLGIPRNVRLQVERLLNKGDAISVLNYYLDKMYKDYTLVKNLDDKVFKHLTACAYLFSRIMKNVPNEGEENEHYKVGG